ncbi:aminotransferase class V-fold PLP-dependent enzyme [Actinobacteria bacterium YIM 96077]|uniref:Aminotransferase n=1 Tax=Phytoactinopolyspora halophila TaxID=1981511 RepID=A0A329QA00_9ACTN|nr:aminotransferase class V-fold PLP-dependent enzyme [Phytoactinopolyspora halophila]AYY14132.1 aminotransferase class V-fold PLP-dependent enzyme [Actinobacteria bacterium YIM 96077]RAW09174.1 aminotransferase [Phytoactinopolyspora halophila]
MATIDVASARADTPGCNTVVHLNNAGAALPPQPVLDAVIGHLELEATSGGYEAQGQASEQAERFYTAVAELIGAQADEIAYVENATRAWDMAFYAIPFRPGERILTTTSEYPANGIAFQQAARRHGVRVDVVPDDSHGQISIDALKSELAAGDVRVVAVNHVPTHNGLVNPAQEIGELCRAAGALYLLDACQSVGQLAVNVDEIGCDLLSATGRKFLRGPRGTGFLYARRDVIETLEPPFLDHHAATWTAPDTYEIREDAKRFETWERFVAGQIGLGVAAGYAAALGPHAIEERVTWLANRLREQLSAVPGVTVRDRGARRCGIVTFSMEGHDPDDVVRLLLEHGINVSWSRVSALQFDPAAVPIVRASVHYYNTEDELDRVVDTLARIRPDTR